MPRKPPDKIVEHRLDLSPFLRKQLEEATQAEKWKDYLDATNKAVLPVAAVGVGAGCVIAAAAFMNWTGIGLTQLANATGRIVKGTVNLVTDPFDTLFGVGVAIGSEWNPFEGFKDEGPRKPRRWDRILAIANRMELLSKRLNEIGGANADTRDLAHYNQVYDLEVESMLNEMQGFMIVPAANQFEFRENFRQYMMANQFYNALGAGAQNSVALTVEWRKQNVALDITFGR